MARRSDERVSYRNMIGFWILGTINNLFYVVIIGAAQSLADQFNASDKIGDIVWATNISGIPCRSKKKMKKKKNEKK